MSSILLKAMKDLGKVKHNVGTLNNWTKEVINQGAIVGGSVSIDNFQLVELSFNANGERICTPLSATTVKGYLIASVEEYLEEMGETISGFYNEVGDRARIFVMNPTRRVEVSNFAKADVAKEIKNGQKVHYDATTKKYIISNGTTDHADYATAKNQFIVVDNDCTSLDGQDLIRLEVIA